MKNGGEVAKTVVVFFGLIASGKSYVAKAWAEKHSFPYNNTDVVRKQLAGRASCESHAETIDQGIYSPTFTRLTYDALLSFAEKALDEVSCVVLDGSYQAQAERERVRKRFEHRARVVFIMCSCKEEIIKTRLAQRALDPAAVSDGNWDIYLRQKEVFEYPEELSVGQFRRLETNKAVGLLLSHLDDVLLNEVSD
ncbi:MAG: AAA family ATPase [Proteobacteria bacterium]|nr:AAA family ATPase [Pseudomonadota bacterium]